MANTFPYNAAQGPQGYGLDLSGSGASPAAQKEATFGAMPYDPRLVARLLQNLDGDFFNRTNGASPPSMSNPEAPDESKPPPTGDKIDQFLDENLPLQEMISMHPMDIFGGGLVGTGVGLAMDKAEKKGRFLEGARRIDRLPIVKSISNFLERNVSDRMRRFKWYNALNPALSDAEKLLEPEDFVAKMAKAEQARQIKALLDPLARRVGSNADIARLHGEIMKGEAKHNFAKLMQFAEGELEKLTAKANNKALAKSERKAADEAAKYLRRTAVNLANSGVQHTLPNFQERMLFLHNLAQKEGVGPIGRILTMFSNDLRKVMGGETMMRAAGVGDEAFKKSSFMSKFLGPFLNGWVMIGQSIRAGRKAQEGEKVKTFFHNLFGIGISSFLGWQIGSRAMRAMNLHNAIFGKRSGSELFYFLRKLRFLQWLPRLTLGGMFVEIVAMFIIGGIFQKFGEKLAHRIFGKPSEASIDPAAAAEAAKAKQKMASTSAGDLHHFRKGFAPFEETRQEGNPQARSAERKAKKDEFTDQNPAIAPEYVPPSALPPGDIAVNKTQASMDGSEPDLSVGALQMNGLLPPSEDVWMPGLSGGTSGKSNRTQMEALFPGPKITKDPEGGIGENFLFTANR